MNFCEGLKRSKVKIQYKDFDTTYPVDTPTQSVKELDEIKERLNKITHYNHQRF